jgi:hypothetical protein
MMALSLETLKERWEHSLLCTDEAICRHSDAYRELKCLVCRINNETIDIGQYLEFAKRITSLLNNIHALAWAALKAMPTFHRQPMTLTEGMKGCG